MDRTIVNTRKIEVIPSYARKNKSAHGLPRHSSFMIMHIFAKWGNTGQNMAESIENTTFSTTKAHGWNWDKVKGVGRNP